MKTMDIAKGHGISFSLPVFDEGVASQAAAIRIKPI
jgi:hypothetical protein